MRADAVPIEWATLILAKLSQVYGTRASNRYAGQDPAAVRASWAEELHGVTRPQILWALNNLPIEHPPNVLQFRELCASCARKPPELVGPPRPPKATPEAIQAALVRLQQVRAGITERRCSK